MAGSWLVILLLLLTAGTLGFVWFYNIRSVKQLTETIKEKLSPRRTSASLEAPVEGAPAGYAGRRRHRW
jgi:hypothetical protein